MKPLVDRQPYFAFFIIASGIELLGKCINSKDDWHTKNGSREDFENAIDNLKAFANYRDYLKSSDIDLYGSLRCGLLHAMMPKDKIILMQGNEPLSLDKYNRLKLCIGTLYQDFSNACTELLSDDRAFLWTNKKKDDVVLYFTDSPNDGYNQATGSTQTIIIKETSMEEEESTKETIEEKS